MTKISYEITTNSLRVRDDATGRFLVVERGDYRFDLARISLLPTVRDLGATLVRNPREFGMFDQLVRRGFCARGSVEI